MNYALSLKKLKFILIGSFLTVCGALHASQSIKMHSLAQQLEVGDIIFIQVKPYPFQKVASTTNSWVNHVGIVVDTAGNEPIVAESTFPFSKQTLLNKFVARSRDGRVAVSRFDHSLTTTEKESILRTSNKRLGILYDTGFNLHSNGEFCSRFVREVINESTGVSIGEVETFRIILDKTPKADLAFWRIWFFGHIPWSRETVTPASLYRSPILKIIYEGNVIG